MALPAVAAAAAKAFAKKAVKNAAVNAAANKASGGNKGGNNNTLIIASALVFVLLVFVGGSVSATIVGLASFVSPSSAQAQTCVLFPDSQDEFPPELEDKDGDGYGDLPPESDIPADDGGVGEDTDLPDITGNVTFPLIARTFYLSSGYGARKAPKSGASTFHRGLDLATFRLRVPILALGDGKVTRVAYDGSSGNNVQIQHNYGNKKITSAYRHMHKVDVKQGDTVTSGMRIGLVGTTGTSTGEHLHFEVWDGTSYAQTIDPKPWLVAAGVKTIGAGIDVPDEVEDIYNEHINLDADGAEVCEINNRGQEGVTNGPWGGFENGKIPLDKLDNPDFSKSAFFRKDAAIAMSDLNAEYKKEFKKNISITDSYRDYAGQVRCRAEKGALCATPGTSNHGWGLAADLGGGINKFGTAEHRWMQDNAATYGWVNPAWAQQNGAKPEPWHWEYVGTTATDDSSTPKGAKKVARSLMAGYNWNRSQFECLEKLWQRESGWMWNADNPTSSAYGIPQALPGNKMASAGADWKTNPRTQIVWGLRYIDQRYETPCRAWGHSEEHNWY